MKLLIPIVFLLLQLPATAQVDSVNNIKVRKVSADSVYRAVEEMPEFPGGNTAFLKYMNSVAYPDSAKEHDIEGTVYVRFVIDDIGNVTDISIPKGANSILNEAALEHVRRMPAWKPGKEQGAPVRVQYVVPIHFVLH